MTDTAIAEAARTARVLVFAVDDGRFCIHLDWVESVYQHDDAPLHVVKEDDCTGRFVIHRGQPALVIDLREAFGLAELLGSTERSALVVVRAGSFLLALQVDACIGVRELDLRTKVPVATSLVRDGGLSVGHLVELDGKLHGLLEPTRILSGSLRENIQPLLQEAQEFSERQEKLAALATELKREPVGASLKAYGRLARRNGRTKAANAVRTVLKALQECEQRNGSETPAGELGAETLLRDLVALTLSRSTGEVVVHTQSVGEGRIFFDNGRIADALSSAEWGRGAFKRILAQREGSYRFEPSVTPVHPQRINDSSLWLLVETLGQLGEERRGRSSR